jgi:hypothetical protein
MGQDAQLSFNARGDHHINVISENLTLSGYNLKS